MMNLARILTGVLLLFFLFTAPSTGEITSVKIQSDNRHRIFFEKSDLHKPVMSPLPSPPFLLPQCRSPPTYHDLILHVLVSILSQMLQDPIRITNSSFNKSHSVTFPSDYSLYFANCNPLSYVTMDVRTEFYNTDNGDTKDYLSAELTQLPSLYSNFSLVYLPFLGFWILVCFKNKLSVNRFHLLMGVLLVMKSLSLFCAAKIHYHTKVTGNPHHGWNVMFHIFQLIKAVLLYIVMMVISDGWFLLKPFVQEKRINNKVLMVVIPIHILATVASIVTGESGRFIKGWMTWNCVVLVIEAACCYVIMLPTEVICSFCDVTRESDQDAKAAKKYLTMFSTVVFGYFGVVWSGIVVQLMSIRSLETTNLVFYMVMFCMFRPFGKNKYFQLNLKEQGAQEEFVLI
ncbi:unnamed protein product [Lactuca saligna]|uniref:Uncharacterized protein n=1 Tax=Lactuca saligna TaxID=75948 RepID=A0AA36E621_LACSI|nr:unnamed protein product [Lactuca saligna]